jgi:hypothetical protein
MLGARSTSRRGGLARRASSRRTERRLSISPGWLLPRPARSPAALRAETEETSTGNRRR